MKDKEKLLVILLSIVTIGGIGILGYTFYKKTRHTSGNSVKNNRFIKILRA